MTIPEPTIFPARLHVLLASNAPRGLVIRRGPSRHVATISWDRRRDEFRLGQWLKGRIYERRSDLSPDGRHFIYFAMNGHWDSEAKGSWTAISRAPYLKALALFPKGDGWHGGGLWTRERRYWLNDGWGHETLRNTGEVSRDRRYEPSENYGGECPGVYYNRLVRDGWRLVEETSDGDDDTFVFDKPLPHRHGWVLRKIAHAGMNTPEGKGCYWDAHHLVHPTSGRKIKRPAWEWADIDRDRLVWATDGKLFAGVVGREGLDDDATTELHDFNAMEFERIEAPY